jgi:hypothetical protein
MNCIAYDVRSATDCQVSEWSEWSCCDVTCGGGLQIQSRHIIAEPTNGGEACPPTLYTVRPCNTQGCSASPNSPTPTPVEPSPVPSPTPVVTPTPTPVITPTPTPPSFTVCQAQLDDSIELYNETTSFTTQCQAWSEFYTCATNLPGSEGESALLLVRQECDSTEYITDLCDCGEGKEFNATRIIEILADFKDLFIEEFSDVDGVFEVTWESVVSNKVNLRFTYDDTLAARDEVLARVSVWTAEFLNLPVASIKITVSVRLDGSVKRAQVPVVATLTVVESATADSAVQVGSVSAISASFALVIMALFAHVF